MTPKQLRDLLKLKRPGQIRCGILLMVDTKTTGLPAWLLAITTNNYYRLSKEYSSPLQKRVGVRFFILQTLFWISWIFCLLSLLWQKDFSFMIFLLVVLSVIVVVTGEYVDVRLKETTCRNS